MKEIHIGTALTALRKEKKMTQEQVANYFDVTKAAVSKWETEQAYPDITLLPKLAAFFGVSVDALLGYEPQMTMADIRKLYHKFAEDFTKRPVEDVLDECEEIIKKYYSCYPLLLQMGLLFFNAGVGRERIEREILFSEANTLFIKVKSESDDLEIVNEALYLEAYCSLALGDPQNTLVLLEDKVETTFFHVSNSSFRALLGTAYQQLGEIKKAKAIMQNELYTSCSTMVGILPQYLSLYTDDPDMFEEIFRRAEAVITLFDFERLHPAVVLPIYFMATCGYMMQAQEEKALKALEKYVELAVHMKYPIRFKGDSFFNEIDNWLKEKDVDLQPPRDEGDIKRNIVYEPMENPIFIPLQENREYKRLMGKLKGILKEEKNN